MTAPDLSTGEAGGWRPDAGDVLVGVVDDLDVGWSDFRGEYPIITIRAGEGTRSANVVPGELVKVHCFHDVLFSRVMTLRPVPGETVGLQFHGKEPHKSKPSQTVSRYTFKVQGRTADAGGLYDRMGTGRVRQPQRQSASPMPMARQVTPPTHEPTMFDPAPSPSADDDIPF